jgi:hypothetical protein
MDPSAQLMMDGLGANLIPDLRNIPLGKLDAQARDGHGPIQDIVARMVDSGDGPPSVSVTSFNSSI